MWAISRVMPRSPRRARAATGSLIAGALRTMAGTCERASASDRAGQLATEALELYRELGDPYRAATALAELGWYDLIRGTGERAEACSDEAFELRRRHGDDRRLVEPLIDAAWLALVQGHQGPRGRASSTASSRRGRSTTGSWSARRSPACRRSPGPSRAGATARGSPAPPRRPRPDRRAAVGVGSDAPAALDIRGPSSWRWAATTPAVGPGKRGIEPVDDADSDERGDSARSGNCGDETGPASDNRPGDGSA